MKSVTVFCASSSGTDERFVECARRLGETLALRGIVLVYGGAKVGLMGAVADAALRAGGKVVGVLPRFLRAKEIAHEQLTELILVESMHERKATMHRLCDGIVTLPGGFGTMEELFETLTWAQLGLHEKPIGLLNVGGFYDDLLRFIQTAVDKGLLKKANQETILVGDTVESVLEAMATYRAPAVEKWLGETTI